MQEEKTLAEGLRKRDPDAWARLYEEYFARVYRYVAMRVRDQTEAEDLTEQVFVNALEAGTSFRWRGAPISAWLFRIARNQVIDYHRRLSSRRMVPLDDFVASSAVDRDPAVNPEFVAERNSEISRMLHAVGHLTQSQRDVIELRFAGGLSTAEVAKILGKSQGAVKVMQHSALAALRKL